MIGNNLTKSTSEESSFEVHSGITITSYTSIESLTDSTPNTTASGKHTSNGTIALSRDMLLDYASSANISFGDTIYVVIGPYRVEDTMNRRKTKCADVWSPSLHVAKVFGKHFNCKIMKRR
jgi:3D (Asp-Asp-Asp) domain-containing protein